MSFFLAMALHPDVMKKAQRELDAVTGRDRLPTFEDRPRLPFVDAVCREVSRWQPVSPLGTSTSEYVGRIAGDLHHSYPACGDKRRRLRRILDTKGCASFSLVTSVLTDVMSCQARL